MVGIELREQAASKSPLLRVASEQDLLGYLIAGHLLADHGIRVAPTLSSAHTLRIQPSALIEEAELDRFCDALASVLAALRAGDAGRLVGHLVSEPADVRPSERTPSERTIFKGPSDRPADRADHLAEQATATRRVVFLAHFLEPGDLRAWDASLAGMTDEQCARLLARTRGVLEPFISHRDVVRSAAGGRVALTVVALPFTSGQVMESFSTGDLAWLRKQIDTAVDLARGEDAAVIGFGGYTSIVTHNCTDIVEDRAIVTSGNSVTSAAAVDATLAEIARLGLPRTELAVVGAVGNIGSVLADVFAEHVDRILLVGRPAARRRLELRADELYAAAWARVQAGVTGGIHAALATSERVRIAAAAGGDVGAVVRAAHVADVGEDSAVIRIATDMAALRACNVIVSATNAPRYVIEPDCVGDGPVVICDIAAPGDVSPEVARARPLATVLKGGLVRLPLGQTVAVRGMRLLRIRSTAALRRPCCSVCKALAPAYRSDHLARRRSVVRAISRALMASRSLFIRCAT